MPIGICVLLNGVWFSESAVLRSMFEKVFSSVAAKGSLVRIGTDGRIRTNANLFAQRKSEIDNIDFAIKKNIDSYSSLCIPLPAQNVSTDPLAIHKLPADERSDSFGEGLKTYRSICATYGNNSDGTTNMLLVKLEEIAKECASYRDQCQRLEKDCKELEKSKKRYATVIGLVCTILLGGAIAIAVIVNKDSEIKKQLATIESNEKELSDLGGKVKNLQQNLEEVQSKYNNITDLLPFNITDIQIGNLYKGGAIQKAYGSTIYDYETMFLAPKLYYTGYISGNRTLKVKLYTPYGSLSRRVGSDDDFTYSQSVQIYKGTNEVELSGWGDSTEGWWSSGTYRIEIWYKDICLKAKTFTIY